MPIRVLASVIRRDDRYLICKRPAHKRHGSLWEFPGGKVEPGEGDPGAVRRELAEELHVTVQRVGPVMFSVRDPGSDFVIEFVPVEIAGDPVAYEHEALAWVRAGDLQDYPLAPSDREFARIHLGARGARVG